MTSRVSSEVMNIPAPRRSWADIVKGKSEPDAPKPLKPAEKGSHRVVCTGEFLVMLGHYGWIMSLQNIDHPDADRHGGRIYLRRQDLRPGAMPKPHDEVTFFLYCDKDGLGAEDCYVTGDPYPEAEPQPEPPVKSRQARVWSVPQSTPCALRADAEEFVPTALPTEATDEPAQSPPMNAHAQEFVPAPSMNAYAQEFVPTSKPSLMSRRGVDVFAINTKRFRDDDEDSDDTESTASDLSSRHIGSNESFEQPPQWSSLASRCARAVEVSDDDGTSWCSDESDDDGDVPSSAAPAWFSVSTRCADAVGKADNYVSWQTRSAAAATKLRADVGDDIRWNVVLDAMAELDDDSAASALARIMPPPGLAPPGLAPPGLAPPGLELEPPLLVAPPGLEL